MFVFVVGYCCESIDYTGDDGNDGNDNGSVNWCIGGEGRVGDWFVTEEMTSNTEMIGSLSRVGG